MSELAAVGKALPAKAQRVGGKNESSTSRRSYVSKAIAAKKPRYPRADLQRELQARREKPTEDDGATLRRKRNVEAHIG
jgi:hypothetical protein